MAVSSLKNKSKLSTLTSPFDIDLGGMIPLSTVAVTSATASITFSDITQTYEHLQIRSIARASNADTNNAFKIQFNSDTGNNYARHELYASGSTLGSEGAASIGFGYADYASTGANAASGIFAVSIIDILDYSNTNKYTTLRVLSGNDRNGSGNMAFGSSLWMNTNAITSISITPNASSNWSQYSHFALYGIKRAGA